MGFEMLVTKSDKGKGEGIKKSCFFSDLISE